MWILETPIKSKKETVEEDMAGCWNALWATSCLWLWQNLHTLLVCVCDAGCCWPQRLCLGTAPSCPCAHAEHTWFGNHLLYTNGKLTWTSTMLQGWTFQVKALPPKQYSIFVLQRSIFLQLYKTFLKCLYITSCRSAECKITSWCLL